MDMVAAAKSLDAARRMLREAVVRRLTSVGALRVEVAGRKRLPRRGQIERELTNLDVRGPA
jgi:hypothetical protein